MVCQADQFGLFLKPGIQKRFYDLKCRLTVGKVGQRFSFHLTRNERFRHSRLHVSNTGQDNSKQVPGITFRKSVTENLSFCLEFFSSADDVDAKDARIEKTVIVFLKSKCRNSEQSQECTKLDDKLEFLQKKANDLFAFNNAFDARMEQVNKMFDLDQAKKMADQARILGENHEHYLNMMQKVEAIEGKRMEAIATFAQQWGLDPTDAIAKRKENDSELYSLDSKHKSIWQSREKELERFKSSMADFQFALEMRELKTAPEQLAKIEERFLSMMQQVDEALDDPIKKLELLQKADDLAEQARFIEEKTLPPQSRTMSGSQAAVERGSVAARELENRVFAKAQQDTLVEAKKANSFHKAVAAGVQETVKLNQQIVNKPPVEINALVAKF